MTREWLITLGNKERTIKYLYYKDGDDYELIRQGENTSAPKTYYKNKGDLVSGVLQDVGGDFLSVIEVPLKYGDFWKKTFKENNLKYPTGEMTGYPHSFETP